jgi:hypothetical protein
VKSLHHRTKLGVTTIVTTNEIKPALETSAVPDLVIKHHSTPASYSEGLGFKSQPRAQVT